MIIKFPESVLRLQLTVIVLARLISAVPLTSFAIWALRYQETELAQTIRIVQVMIDSNQKFLYIVDVARKLAQSLFHKFPSIIFLGF